LNQRGQRWGIVLAGGSGTRLWSLTGGSGAPVPKQYCSLRGGRSLLAETIARAARVVPRERIVVVVVEEHRPYWEREVARFPGENVLVQPCNRGTALGVLLPLLVILERDPGATILCLPSDHFVREERVLERAFASLTAIQSVVLLGIVPESAETGYGWILPGPKRSVRAFVEKPSPPVARDLMLRGGVWSSFVLVATGRPLLELFQRRLSGPSTSVAAALAEAPHGRGRALEIAYAGLDPADFSRDVLEGAEPSLRLEVVPSCGWTDLGTPERLERCLAEIARREPIETHPKTPWNGVLDLSQRIAGGSRRIHGVGV